MTIQIKRKERKNQDSIYYLVIDNYKVYAGTLKEVNRLAYKQPKREV